ncbi:MAG TPA: J domain-containing protein [Streptosporangiaceae bacterium]|nr:J domain-containing protein [Streptosporangiaceae bacterium]
MTSPFDILGLDAGGAVTDDDVRSAWRRLAAATHPDRADGGDPVAFAAAAAAYTALRTAAARREVRADIRDQANGRPPGHPVPRQQVPLRRRTARTAQRIAHGRPARLATRLLVTGGVGALAVTAVGWQPASAAVITGALTWLFLTGRADLAARQSRR